MNQNVDKLKHAGFSKSIIVNYSTLKIELKYPEILVYRLQRRLKDIEVY